MASRNLVPVYFPTAGAGSSGPEGANKSFYVRTVCIITPEYDGRLTSMAGDSKVL